MTLAEEYRRSLKMAEAEELLDLLIYRPVAFVLVKVLYHLPITPNQMTYASLVAGLFSAMEFARGTDAGFRWGALWYAAANVLDCGDGMLARLKHSGTPLGRLVDGVVDWISSIAIFFGLGMGMSAYFGSSWYWLLAVAAGIVSGYHAMAFDKRQQEYITAVRGEEDFTQRETAKIERELLTTRSPARRIVLSLYMWYMRTQQHSMRNGTAPGCTPTLYRLHNRRIMRWWTWLGPTTNRTLLVIAGLLSRPDWFCWFVVVPTNVYLVGLLRWQRRINTRVRNESERPAPASVHVST